MTDNDVEQEGLDAAEEAVDEEPDPGAGPAADQDAEPVEGGPLLPRGDVVEVAVVVRAGLDRVRPGWHADGFEPG